jgi:hypothetical protein
MDNFFKNKRKASTPTGKSPTPNPSPFSKNENGEGSEGSSLAVLQFVALMRGEWVVQAPRSPFLVVRVFAEERYCLGCCGVRWFDVICGTPLPSASPQIPLRGYLGGEVVMAICRCCGAESVR